MDKQIAYDIIRIQEEIERSLNNEKTEGPLYAKIYLMRKLPDFLISGFSKEEKSKYDKICKVLDEAVHLVVVKHKKDKVEGDDYGR